MGTHPNVIAGADGESRPLPPDLPELPMMVDSEAPVAWVFVLLLLVVGCSRPDFLRVARVEGDTQRYTIRELEDFPPAAQTVYPGSACNEPERPMDRPQPFNSSFYYPFKSPMYRPADAPEPRADSLILRAKCGLMVPRDESKDRCYQFTMEAERPAAVSCEAYDARKLASASLPSKLGSFQGRNLQYRDQKSDPPLELVVSEDAGGAGFSLLPSGGLLGPGRGSRASYLEVLDTRQRKRVVALTTTKGLWELSPAWFAVGQRARIVALLSHTHTVIIDIHPAPGE